MALDAFEDTSPRSPLVVWLSATGRVLNPRRDAHSSERQLLSSRALSSASSVPKLPVRAEDSVAALNAGPHRPALDRAPKLEMVGMMTSGIAHDFNNHLQTIIASLAAMERRIRHGEAAEISRLVGLALDSSAAAAALSRRLLEFSKAAPPNPQRLTVNAAIASMSDLLRWTLGPGINLQLALGDFASTTTCDPSQFENAILNLAINARDAMAYGGTLRIDTCLANLVVAFADLPLGQYVRICVADDGAGMESQVVDRAFEPFFTTKAVTEGTGLGLAMTKAFAEQAHGHIDIKSAPGAGTTVSLYLPLR